MGKLIVIVLLAILWCQLFGEEQSIVSSGLAKGDEESYEERKARNLNVLLEQGKYQEVIDQKSIGDGKELRSIYQIAEYELEKSKISKAKDAEKKAKGMVAELEPEKSKIRKTRETEEESKQLPFNECGCKLYALFATDVKPERGVAYFFSGKVSDGDDVPVTLKIKQFISSRNADLSETLSNAISGKKDTSTSVIVRAGGWSGRQFCIRIIDDRHSYVDDDSLDSCWLKYVGVKDFVGSRIHEFEEIPIPQIYCERTAGLDLLASLTGFRHRDVIEQVNIREWEKEERERKKREQEREERERREVEAVEDAIYSIFGGRR